MVGPDGNAPSSLAYRASALLLSYEPVAESGGLAPQPATAGPSVFETAPAPRRIHSPRKMSESSGPAPQALRPEPASNRTPRSAALLSKVAEARGHAPQRRCRPIRFKRVPVPRPVSPPKVPPAGFAPASIRLEGGGLNCSATGSGPRGGTPTRNPAFEAPHDGNFTTRGKRWSPHEELHLDFGLRGPASCLLDDEGKIGARRRGRTGLVRLTRSARRSLRLTGTGCRAG